MEFKIFLFFKLNRMGSDDRNVQLFGKSDRTVNHRFKLGAADSLNFQIELTWKTSSKLRALLFGRFKASVEDRFTD